MSNDPRPDENTVTLPATPPPPTENASVSSEEGAGFQPPSSPVELANRRFPKTLFGYRTRDVDEHLVHLAREWEGILLPSRTAMSALGVAVDRAEGRRPYESVGEEVGRILSEAHAAAEDARRKGAQQYETAAQAAEKQLTEASEERTRILAEAAAESERMVAEATSQREQILAEASAQREQILQGALQERDALNASNAELRARLSGIVDGVAPLLAAAPDLPAPVGREAAPEAAPTVEILPDPAPQEEPSTQPRGIQFLETALRPDHRSGAQRRSRR